MTIEVAFLLSAVSIAFSIFFGLKNSKRNDTKDTEERTEERMSEIAERTKENAIINVKLDNINSSNREIKDQVSSLVEKVDAHGDRLTKVEESLVTAWKRIDEIIKRLNREDDE